MNEELKPCPNDFWYTPPLIMDVVSDYLGAHYDPCPINPNFDGLKSSWTANCFINPPYSRKLKRSFIDKAITEFRPEIDHYVWLLNYANSEDLFDIKARASAVCLPDKRVKFIAGHPELQESSPRYDNIIVLWGEPSGFYKFEKIGKVFYVR